MAKLLDYTNTNLITFFKKTQYQREPVIPETEDIVPSNAIKSDLIVID